MPILANPLLVGGNSEGSDVSAGTQDAFALNIISNNSTRMSFASAGGATISTPLVINSGVNDDVQLTIKAPVDTGPVDTLTKWTTSTGTQLASVNAAGVGAFQSLVADDISVGSRLNMPFGTVINTDFGTDIWLNATGAVPGKDVFLNFNHTADRSYSFPDSDMTIVGDVSVQTLTNKKLSDSTTTIVDVSDPTKVIKFNAAGTTGKTTTIASSSTVDRTITLPDATDTLVGKATSDVFTNKTFDADGSGNSISNIENADIKTGAAIDRTKTASGSANHVLINDGSGVMSSEASLAATRGGTGQTTLTTGDILYASASNTLSKLAGSTSAARAILTQTGTGSASAAPVWAADGWEMLYTGTMPSNGTSLSSGTITARAFLMVCIYIEGYTGGGNTASLQFNNSAGTAYRYRWLTSAAGATTFTGGLIAASTDRIKVGAADTTNSRNSVAFITNDLSVTEKLVTFPSQTHGTGSAATQSVITMGNGAWISGASTQITRIDLISSSNMVAGTGMVIFGRDFA